MRGCAVQIIVILLDIFPVVALFTGQAKEALLENGVATIPQCQGETDLLVVVADAAQTIFPPTKSPGARLVIRQIIPGCSIGAIVFPHRPPRPFAQIRPPLFPMHAALTRLL